MVSVEGFSKRQFQIQLTQDKLRLYGLSLQTIATRIAQQNLDLPVGEIQTAERDYQIRVNDERRSPDELRDLVIIKGKLGAPSYLMKHLGLLSPNIHSHTERIG